MSGQGQADIAGIIAAFLYGGRGPGGYYFPVMIQFIFMYPIIYFIIRKYEFKGVIICGFINFAYELLKWGYGMTEGCYRLLSFRYILVIAFGCYLSLGKFKSSWRACTLSIVCGALFIVLVRYFNHVPKIIAFWTGTSFIAVLYIMPIVAWLLKKHLFTCKFLEVVGKASFDIFLCQKVYFLYMECGHSIGNISNHGLQIIFNIVICTIFGICFYYVESQLTRGIKNWTLQGLQMIDVKLGN